MDGTLVDSMPYWSRLSVDYLNGKGFPGEFEELMDRIRTMTMPEACLLLKNEFSLPEAPEEIRVELDAVMRAHYARDIPLKEGAGAYLASLRREGAHLCVVTATALPLVHLCLGRLGVEEYFDFIMSCEEVGRGKDYPDAFLEAARRLGAAPEEIAVFEDSPSALRTARGAGFHAVAFYDEHSGSWEECLREADRAVRSWTEIVG